MPGLTVRAVLFDVGNTLTWVQHGALARFCTESGVPRSLEAMRRAEFLARVDYDQVAPTLPTLSGTFRLYMNMILERAGIAPGVAREAILNRAEAYDRSRNLWSDLAPDANEVLRRLKARKFHLGVISNTDHSIRDMLKRYGVDNWFDTIVESYVEKIEKPDPEIFKRACLRMRVEPSDAVYVGDLYGIDVLGARSAGLQGVLMDPGDVWKDVDCPKVRSLLELYEMVELKA